MPAVTNYTLTSASSGNIDIDLPGDAADSANDGVQVLHGNPDDPDLLIQYAQPIGSGTGTYDTFLRVQANSAEIGFNSDANSGNSHTPKDDTKSSPHTHALLISSLSTVKVGGVDYYQFRLDINESSAPIKLTTFKIFTTSNANATTVVGQNLIYDMGANTVDLVKHSSGSGDDDYVFLVPVSLFSGNPPANTYLTLQAGFTGSDSGFEEFRALTKTNTPVTGQGVLAIVKTADVTDVDQAGDVIHYTIQVSNTGDAALTGVVVTDPLTGNTVTAITDGGHPNNVGDLDNDNQLDPGEIWQYTTSYTVTAADMANHGNPAGSFIIDNFAFANAVGAPEVSAEATVDVLQPALGIGKSVDSVTDVNNNGLTDAGDIINYNIHVSNDGNSVLTGVVVTDPLTGGVVATGVTLNIGQAIDYKVSYTLTQGDIDSNGYHAPPDTTHDNKITNTATADSDQTDLVSASVDTPIDYAPSIKIEKTITSVDDNNGDQLNDAGDTIHYKVVVTNSGDVTLTGVTVTDPLTGGVLATGVTLAPGATATYTPTYVISQADVDSHGVHGAEDATADDKLTNTATANSAQAGPVSSSVDQPLDYKPSASIDKTAVLADAGATADAVGDVINYTITVKNTGDVTLTNPVLTDSLPTLDGPLVLSGDADSDGKLDVGETWVYTGSHTITQADLDSHGAFNDALNTVSNGPGSGAGVIANTADFTSNETAKISDSVTTPLTYAPGLDTTKTVLAVTNPDTSHDPSKQGDEAGDVISYQIAVKNTGNITLTAPVVTDPLADGASAYVSGDTDNDGKLSVGETWLYAAQHTVTQDDLDSKGAADGAGDGKLTNTAKGVANDTDGAPHEDSGSVDTPLVYNPKVDVEKTGVVRDGVADKAGDWIDYTVTVANTGNITLTGVALTDALLGVGGLTYASGDADSDGKLDVGETWTYTGAHQVTQAELDNKGNSGHDGFEHNVVSVSTNENATDTDETTNPLVYSPHMAATKTANHISNGKTSAHNAGDIVFYDFTVTNDGNVTLNPPTLADPLVTSLLPVLVAGYNSGDTNHNNLLDVGETWNYTGKHTVTQTELDNKGNDPTKDGLIHNTVNVTDTTNPLNDPVQASASATAPVDYDPKIHIVKSVAGVLNSDNNPDEDQKVDTAGDKVNYKFLVTNTGNVTLNAATVTDSLAPGVSAVLGADLVHNVGDTNNDGLLQLTETWQFTAQMVVTQAQIDAAMNAANHVITNTATVTDTGVSGTTVTDTSSASVDVKLLGPGVRTPGFWYNNGAPLWDGDTKTMSKAQYLPTGTDLAYLVDSNNDGTADTKAGILIGDWNHNGKEDVGENTLFISRADALTFLNASQKQQGDARWVLARDLVATWLNALAGNGVGDPSDLSSPRHYVDDAVAWLIKETADHNHSLTVAELNTGAVPTSSALWNAPVLPIDLSGATMHSGLDGYNNTGKINGHYYAPPDA